MDEMLEKLVQTDPLVWADVKGLQLSDGVRFSLKGRPYLVGIVKCDKRVMSCKKGAQVCMTTAKYIEALHSCVYRFFDKNIIYMLPTVDQAEKLSKISFDPIFRYNGWLKKMVSNDSASIKTINGRSIVFVGARSQKVGDGSAKDSVNLRSIPADAVYRDEIDMMDEDMVDLSRQRLNASDHRIECNFSSPTVPSYGIDLLYEEGDQRKWQIPCKSCGKYTCIVESFPKSILKKDGRWYRACVHCGAEIFVADGEWQVTYADRRDASFWIDGLISPSADLEGYMHRYHNSEGAKLAEFHRSILGMAYVEASCQLSVHDVINCCRPDGMQYYNTLPAAMGIDVGEKLHYKIGIRTGRDTYHCLAVGIAHSLDEIYDLGVKMGVKVAVIDKGPDIFGVKDLQKKAPFKVYRCLYSEYMTTNPDFDGATGIVKANRNEICDKTHHVITNRKLALPRRSPEIDNYAEQLTKMAKSTINHPETGLPKTKWIKLGNKEDHYFHATNYFLLAASQLPVAKQGVEQKQVVFKNNFYI